MTTHDHLASSPADDEHAVGGRPTSTGPYDAEITMSPVPVAVWWLDDRDRDSDAPATRPEQGFASRLSRRLVLTYTRRGDALIDLDGDATRRGTAKACAREYLGLTKPADIAGLDQVTGQPTMVILSWPRPHTTTTASINDLFLACSHIMPAGSGIVAVACEKDITDATQQPSQFKDLQAAASAIGFAHVRTIVAISTPGGGDRYLFYATADEANAAITASRRDAPRRANRFDLFASNKIASRDD